MESKCRKLQPTLNPSILRCNVAWGGKLYLSLITLPGEIVVRATNKQLLLEVLVQHVPSLWQILATRCDSVFAIYMLASVKLLQEAKIGNHKTNRDAFLRVGNKLCCHSMVDSRDVGDSYPVWFCKWLRHNLFPSCCWSIVQRCSPASAKDFHDRLTQYKWAHCLASLPFSRATAWNPPQQKGRSAGRGNGRLSEEKKLRELREGGKQQKGSVGQKTESLELWGGG